MTYLLDTTIFSAMMRHEPRLQTHLEALDATLVSADRDFRRITHVQVVDWTK